MIYADAQASTPIDPRVADAISEAFDQSLGNPHSTHMAGQQAMKYVDDARRTLAQFFGVQFHEVIFTSGATEANNLAIQGILLEALESQSHIEVITTPIEHSAVLEPLQALKTQYPDQIELKYLSVGESGVVDPDQLSELLTDKTVLVSVMHANNEIGTIQPIRDLARVIRKWKQEQGSEYPYFHSDGAQAPFFLPENLSYGPVDLYSISGHKVYGPKGIGALIVREGTKIAPLVHGGGQEYQLRPGTVSPELTHGLKTAFNLIQDNDHETTVEHIRTLRNRLLEALLEIPGVSVNGSIEHRLPNNINISVEGLSSETAIIQFDLAGVALSAGSACHSGAFEPSHVVEAIAGPERATSALRISLSQFTTEQEIDQLINVCHTILKK